MKHFTIVSLVAAALTLGAQDAHAQVDVGINVGYNIDAEEWFAGGQVRFDPPAFPIIINPSVETYFIDGLTMLQFDVNALYPFGIQNAVFTPYAGGGMGLTYTSAADFDASTNASLNLVAGANFGFGRLKPIAEARIAIGDGTAVSVRGGLLFGL